MRSAECRVRNSEWNRTLDLEMGRLAGPAELTLQRRRLRAANLRFAGAAFAPRGGGRRKWPRALLRQRFGGQARTEDDDEDEHEDDSLKKGKNSLMEPMKPMEAMDD